MRGRRSGKRRPVNAPDGPAGRFVLEPAWLRGEALTALFTALEPVGEARVVGGAVRNAVLGLDAGDIDIATTALPVAVAEASQAAGFVVHETGLDHGTLTVVVRGHPFEVTTLREDVATDGRRATVRFTSDWAADAGRRDFTLNALTLARDGTLTDYVGGYADCLEGRVRFIGDPDTRILEDHLRILRFFRFIAGYGRGPPDPDGLAAVRRHRHRLVTLAAERVHKELARTLTAARAAEVAALMAAGGFLDPFVPPPHEVALLRGVADAERIGGRQRAPVLAFAALVGFDAARFEGVANVLKFSRRERSRGLGAIVAHRQMPPRSMRHLRSLLYDHGAEAVIDGLICAVARGTRVPDFIASIREADGWQKPRLPVGGDDLLVAGGVPGPGLGRRLADLEEHWRASDFALSRDELLTLDRARFAPE